MISSEVAGLALSVTVGVIKLGRRVDQIMAEEAALRSALAVPFPTIAFVPTIPQLKARLRGYLEDSADERPAGSPDQLGPDRDRLTRLLAPGTPRGALEDAVKSLGLADFVADEFDPNEEFRRALTASNAAWQLSLSDDDVQRLTFYVAAGADYRENSLAFRIGATVVDVLAEFATENARLIVSNNRTRGLLEVVLRRFAEPDLATMPGWGSVLRHAVRATVNGLLDARGALAEDRQWLEISLSAIARARDLAPEHDDFIIGLLRGDGMRQLMRGVLEEGAQRLLQDDAPVARLVLGEVLGEAARLADTASGFDGFFFDNWNALAAAGLRGLATHGRGLIRGQTPLLQRALVAAVGALADGIDKGPPTGHTLTSTIEAMIAVVADDPALLDDAVGERWLAEFIGAVADTVADVGLLNAFGAPAVERYVREALDVMSRHPEVLVGDSDVLQALLRNTLGGIAGVDVMTLESIGDAVVAGALEAIADNADLIDGDYAAVLGNVAGGLAVLVKAKRLTRIQAADLIGIAAEALASNETLFVNVQRRLTNAIVSTVLDAADASDSRLLGGHALVATIERVLSVMSVRGAKLLDVHELDEFATRLREVLDASLDRARAELGRRLDRRTLPAVLGGIVDAWARDEIPAADTPEFALWFTEFAEHVATAVA